MTEADRLDDVSSLAREISARVSALCPHVPTGELAELTSRLALSELAHASGVSFENDEPENTVAPLGNRIAWLPGPSGAAIVLPAAEERPRAGSAAAHVVAWSRRYGAQLGEFAERGCAILRQLGSLKAQILRTRTATLSDRTLTDS